MREALRIRRWLIGVLVLAAVAVAAVSVVPGSAQKGSSRFYASCIAPFASYPPEKLAIFEHECRVRAAASANVTLAEEEAQKAKLSETSAARQAGRAALEAASPPQQRQTEVHSDAEGPIGMSQRFGSTSNWVGEAHGQWCQVYAGVKLVPGTTIRTASELLLYALSAKPLSAERPILVGTYAPPSGGREPLKIVSYHGDVLRIRAAGGRCLLFDVADRSFVRR
jgi:hypothetical protein